MKPIATGEELVGHGVVLTPLSEAEIDLLRVWRGRDDIRVWFGDSSVITPDGQRAWFDRYARKLDDVMFIIRRVSDYRPIGAIALYDIDRGSGTAEYGRIMIGEPAARGTGAALEASHILCQWGFSSLALSRIALWVLKNNSRAISLYERLGFEARDPAEPRPEFLYMELDRSRFPGRDHPLTSTPQSALRPTSILPTLNRGSDGEQS